MALSELTTAVLAEMGIILRPLQSTGRHTGGKHSNRFTEFDDEDEQEMEEEAVYSSTNREDILTMQQLDESTGIISSPKHGDIELPMSPDINNQNYLNGRSPANRRPQY